MAAGLGTACVVALLFTSPALFGEGLVFAAVNVVLAAQASMIAWHFWRERKPASVSSHGLVLAYGVMAASFAARVVEGVAFLDRFTSYLPLDGTLPAPSGGGGRPHIRERRLRALYRL